MVMVYGVLFYIGTTMTNIYIIEIDIGSKGVIDVIEANHSPLYFPFVLLIGYPFVSRTLKIP